MAVGSTERVFSPELVLVSPELRDEAYAYLDEPWLVRKEHAPAIAREAERRRFRTALPRWLLLGISLLVANVVVAAWNVRVLTRHDGIGRTAARAPTQVSTTVGGHRPIASPAQRRTSGTLGAAAIQEPEGRAATAPSRSVSRSRRQLVDRASIAGGGYSWRGGHFLVAPDGLTVTRFNARLCARLGPLPLPPMQIDALGRFGLRRTLRAVDIRIAGTFVTDNVARGTVTTRGRGCKKHAVFEARLS